LTFHQSFYYESQSGKAVDDNSKGSSVTTGLPAFSDLSLSCCEAGDKIPGQG
jgi:hypothetical protein